MNISKWKKRLEAHERAYRALATDLAHTGFLYQGTVLRQRLTCGRDACACHTNPRRRHGPYPYWSSKAKGRTVSRLLTAEEADLYEEWMLNRRALQATLRKMYALSKKVAPIALKIRKAQPTLPNHP
jgi:hypothetical protein